MVQQMITMTATTDVPAADVNFKEMYEVPDF
jgi:hypothetical protein